MHPSNRTARLTPASTVRACPSIGCEWQIVSDSAVLAEMEQATHRMDVHAILPERRQIQNLVASYRQILGGLPTRLLVMAVTQVMDTPATTPVEVVSAA